VNPWDKLKALRKSLTEDVRTSVLLESDVSKYSFAKNFYKMRVELIQENLDTLKDGNYIISLTEYKLILRDHYYNNANYREASVGLIEAESALEMIRDQVKNTEKEMDDLIKDIEKSSKVLNFTKRKANE
jgi:hypothetical protein